MLEDRKTARAHVEDVVRRVVRPAIYPRRKPLEVTAHHVHGEPITPAEAYRRAFEPFAVGGSWGGRWDTTWFRMSATVPEDWAGEEVVARIDLGGGGVTPSFTAEAQIWSGTDPVQGLHHMHRDHRIARAAKGGEPVELFVEAAANPVPPFHSADWPLLGPDHDGAPMYVLTKAELAVVDRDVEALWFDLRTLTQLVDHVPLEPRNSQVFRALSDAINVIDGRDVAGSAKAARAVLAPVLSRPSTSGHHVTAVGHAHIDSAWLWPVRETKRKCARTFSNQLRLMDDYPEHRFACSQAQQYAWIRDEYPSLFARIKDAVARGQWEPVGGMWVEPDTNVPSGESLVRQVVLGKRFFLDELGVESHELWIPDVFGYSAALPQIARQAGVTALITQKLSWNNMNRFPHSTFWWEGLDGSRILTHFPPADTYNGVWSVRELAGSIERFVDHGRSDRSLYPFGFGDGGGGPTREMLEYARRMGDLDGLPRAEIGNVGEFVDAVAAEDGDALDTWVGELYFELHRGTYTTQAATKLGNRRGEEALREAELWSTAACATAGEWASYPAAELQRAWELLLLNQFHDIIPGSSIHWVYEDARRDHAEVLRIAGAAIARAQSALATGIGTTVFNPSGRDRTEVVDVPGRGLAMATAPACGWGPLREVEVEAVPVTIGEGVLENEHLRVRWDADGLLTSVWDTHAAREVLAGRGNLFQVHEDNPVNYDAWDVDLTYLDTVTDVVDVDEIAIVERGPLRASVRFVRRFGASSITQTMRLDAGSRRLEFHTEVDWHENHRFLKVAFPVDVRSSRATYEIQHGHLERPTVWNTSWDLARFEVCAQRWADLSEAGYGVALLNDSKYGYDIHGNVMRLSLLRAPGWPDPEADRGQHVFAYALLPHTGTFQDAGVAAEAEAFNLPLDVVDGAHASAPTRSFVSVDRRGVSIEAVKKADTSDAIVVRLCEIDGGRGPVTLRVDAPFTRAARTDLLERDTGEVAVDGRSVTLTLHPFELVTLKLS
jgi:alpha-mannosidase